MATGTHKTIRPLKQAKKPQLSAPRSEPATANEHTSIDSLDVMEEVMKFFLRRAIEVSDEEIAKRFARDADRAFKELARYQPFYNRLSRAGFDMLDLKQAKALLSFLSRPFRKGRKANYYVSEQDCETCLRSASTQSLRSPSRPN
jgi:hypothetical protein